MSLQYCRCLYFQVIVTELRQFEQWVLTDEGSEVVRDGSHEARVYRAVDPQNGTLQADIMVCIWLLGSSFCSSLISFMC